MRADLRLSDLGSSKRRTASKLMNTKIPLEVHEDIHRIAREIGCSKTELVIALFNEGLDAADEKLADLRRRPPRKAQVVPRDRQCAEPGCERARVAKGLCSNHYQAARRAVE